MEIWDAYYRDGSLAGVDLIRGEDVPDGLYHLICEVLVCHTDGDYLLMRRDLNKPVYPGYYEATAGGSALKGEDTWMCISRELREETGICSEEFQLVAHTIIDETHCIFDSYVCTTDWEKDKITLQVGETIAYKWISEAEFREFVNSEEMIDTQKQRYENYFREKGWIR